MTNGGPDDESSGRSTPETREAFEAAVRALLLDAHADGVPIDGGIDVYGDDHAWSVEITELAVDTRSSDE